MSKKENKINRINRINGQARPLSQGFINWMDKNMPVFIIYESGKKNRTVYTLWQRIEIQKTKV